MAVVDCEIAGAQCFRAGLCDFQYNRYAVFIVLSHNSWVRVCRVGFYQSVLFSWKFLFSVFFYDCRSCGLFCLCMCLCLCLCLIEQRLLCIRLFLSGIECWSRSEILLLRREIAQTVIVIFIVRSLLNVMICIVLIVLTQIIAPRRMQIIQRGQKLIPNKLKRFFLIQTLPHRS